MSLMNEQLKVPCVYTDEMQMSIKESSSETPLGEKTADEKQRTVNVS